MRRGDFERLAKIAIRLNRSIEDMIEKAVRRVWLTEESDAETPPTPGPSACHAEEGPGVGAKLCLTPFGTAGIVESA